MCKESAETHAMTAIAFAQCKNRRCGYLKEPPLPLVQVGEMQLRGHAAVPVVGHFQVEAVAQIERESLRG